MSKGFLFALAVTAAGSVAVFINASAQTDPAPPATPAARPGVPSVPPSAPVLRQDGPAVPAVGAVVPPAPGLAAPSPAALPLPGAAAQSVAQGKVQRVLINPYGEADGLRMEDGTIVRFPPHMSEALTAAVKAGDNVRVLGRLESRGTVAAETIVNVARGQTVVEMPAVVPGGAQLPPHLRAQKLQPQQVEGRIDAVLTGPRGETNGVILADGSIVRFPPDTLRMPVQPGAPFAASGLGTRNALGTSLEAVNVGATLASLQPLFVRTP